MIKYRLPESWIIYNPAIVGGFLVEAKAAVLSLQTVPYQKEWVETLQEMQLKLEVAGTSKIEGAEFTDRELEAAMKETPEQLLTRSQKQAHAALKTYQWLSKLPKDRPVDLELIKEIHRRIVQDADDDHCIPGKIRQADENVTYGQPVHRGAEGGEECEKALRVFTQAIQREFRDHDPLIQALAAHYHFAAIHSFLDGNGRSARALEALMLQRAGLKDTCFIPMSNYYNDEKISYLTALNKASELGHDLTPFLVFGLKGIALHSRRLLEEIQRQISKELFRNLMYKLFTRLKNQRKRAIGKRQIEILNLLLDHEWMSLEDIIQKTLNIYGKLKNPRKAVIRDLNDLLGLKAIKFDKLKEGGFKLGIRLEWPTEITETAFFEQLKSLPKGRTYSFLQ